jgi:hypothetical protein
LDFTVFSVSLLNLFKKKGKKKRVIQVNVNVPPKLPIISISPLKLSKNGNVPPPPKANKKDKNNPNKVPEKYHYKFGKKKTKRKIIKIQGSCPN